MSLFKISFHVSRETVINKPVNEVFPLGGDLKNWKHWSPWQYTEPTMQTTYTEPTDGVGGRSAWKSDYSGSGNMTITEIERNKKVVIDLLFLTPWKSEAKTWLTFEDQGGKTIVRWEMDSSVPIFMFFMKGMFEQFIGLDYERGLRMMKEYVETGEVLSRVDMQGVIDLPEQYYVGTQRHGTIKESDKSMKEAFPTLMQYVSDKQIQTVGVPGSIYHVFDFKTGKMHYTAMAPVSKETYEGLEVEDGMLKGMVPATKAVKVAHTGSYKNLDNPWMAGFSYIRGKKLKQNKAIVPMDIYIDDPRKVEDKNLRTEIYIPVK